MDWQMKAAALNALAEINVCIRAPGDWYVHQDVEVGGNGFLTGSYGNGETPEEAICDHWSKLTDGVSPGNYLVTRKYGKRIHVRWNGFMWSHLPTPEDLAQPVPESAA